MNEYLNELYKQLKRDYEPVSSDDLDSLYRYCVLEANWGIECSNDTRKSITEKLSNLCKYESTSPRLYCEFPDSLRLIFDTWGNLSDDNKLTFGDKVDVEVPFGRDAYNELLELRKARAK